MGYFHNPINRLFPVGMHIYSFCLNHCVRRSYVLGMTSEEFSGTVAAETGEARFRDPYEDHHWGYPVLSAVWKTPDLKLRAGFKFMGSKGDYYFLVTLEAHGPEYEF